MSERVENACLDMAYRNLGAPSKPTDDIVLLLADSRSLLAMRGIFADRETPPWPWQRLFFGAVADFLQHAGARAVAIDLDFFGETPYDIYEDDSIAAARAFRKSGIVYLALNFKNLGADAAAAGGARAAAGFEPVGKILERNRLAIAEEAPMPLGEGLYNGVQVPYGPLAAEGVARRLGCVNAVKDPGGGLRRTPLVVPYKGSVFSSLALSVYLDLAGVKNVSVTRGGRLRLDGLSVPVDAQGRYIINWYGPEQTFASYTIHEAVRMALADYERRCPPATCEEPLYWNESGFSESISAQEVAAYAERFRGKTVFIGVNAAELGDVWSNPFSQAFPGVEVHATVLSNLLSGRMLERLSAGARLSILLGLSLLVGAGTGLLGGEMKGLVFFLAVLAAYTGAFAYCFHAHLLWIDLAAPLLAGTLAYSAVTLVLYFRTGRLRRRLRKTFDRVLQPELVEFLLRDPRRLELGGETRNLTVLFSDLKNFTAIAEKLPASDLVTSLNEYFSRFSGIAVANGAYVDKYIGDAVMAVWGAPVPVERHAARACRAALELKAALAELPWPLLPEKATPPLTRIGINTGEMVVGMVGSEGAAHYTVMGDNVVVASRLEGANKLYGTQILLGEGCYNELREDIAAREIDLVVLKGKSRPLRIYEPVAMLSSLEDSDRDKIGLFAEALDLYRARKWQEAAAAFQKVLVLDPDDGPARMFRGRCLEYSGNEPSDSWRGEFIMPGK